MDALTTESFRARMSEDIKKFHTRNAFDQPAWDDLVGRFHYMPAGFDDARRLPAAQGGGGPARRRVPGRRQRALLLRHRAAASSACISEQLHKAGFKDGPGWKRIIVEKPFGTDLASALELNKDMLGTGTRTRSTASITTSARRRCRTCWPSASPTACSSRSGTRTTSTTSSSTSPRRSDVEGRGGYYDSSGVLRDMMQNHMFQMLAYLCMEPPASFEPDAIRNEKAKLLEAVRVYTPEEVARYVVRGQYGPELGRPTARSSSPATARRRTSTRSRTPRPSRRRACTSTTGAGKACRSTCARARRCGSAAPRSSCSSRRRPR